MMSESCRPSASVEPAGVCTTDTAGICGIAIGSGAEMPPVTSTTSSDPPPAAGGWPCAGAGAGVDVQHHLAFEHQRPVDHRVRADDDARRLRGHQRLLLKQFETLAQPHVEFHGLAVEALSRFLRPLAGLLLLRRNCGVQQKSIAFVLKAFRDQLAGLRQFDGAPGLHLGKVVR